MAETALSPEKVRLKIDDQVFEGWTSVKVTRSLDSLCAGFALGLVDREPGQTDRSAIRDQASCELFLGDDLFLTGFIYDIDDYMAERSHQIQVAGRDKTGDLVDCSAEASPNSWKNQRLETIARQLLKPFGLDLRLDASTGAPFALFALEPGEKVLEAITRMSQMRGVMIKTDIDGTVVIYTPSRPSAAVTFEHGVNTKSFRVRSSSANRFSRYVLKGQHRGGNVAAKDAAGPKGTATDPVITRYRPITIISNEQATASGLQSRAKWEATTRMGKALTIEVTVPGWRQGKTLYAAGQIARVISAYHGIDREMMISAVTFSLDGGTVTAVTLVLPEAFTTEAILEPKVKTRKKRSGLDYASAFGDE